MFSLRVGRFLRVIGNGTWTLRITVPCHFQKFPRNLATTSTSTPWFVDPEDVEPPSFARRPTPHFSENDDEAVLLEIPSGVPDAIRVLHNELSTSPFLEPATLIVRKPLNIPAGPPLPERKPRGKRKRGGTYAGESQLDSSGGIWNWIVMAQVQLQLGVELHTFSLIFIQVKEGTEARGSIESVVRIVRTTVCYPLALASCAS